MEPGARRATVSEHDREYFRMIGRMKEESHLAAIAAHQALPPRERLLRGLNWSMSQRWRQPADRADDRPEEFYDRAKRLGLYRG